MNVTMIDTGARWEVHAAGCADLNKKALRRFVSQGYTAEFSSRWECALDHCADFIYGGEMHAKDALNELHFMPCANNLPVGNMDEALNFEAPVAEMTEFEKMVKASADANARVFGK